VLMRTESASSHCMQDGVNTFHEKAGRSQVDSFWFFIRRAFVLPSGHCRHASIRTLEERFVSLGACWAFSVQPGAAISLAPCGSVLRVEPGPGD